jgi:ribonuclease PH
LRPTLIELDAVPYAEGSCLIATGNTRVLCAASVLDEVPEWRIGSGKGWVTAEYGMLPRATHSRGSRERNGPKGRTQEIQRLIGRSLRSVTDLGGLGSRTITLDCDVLQADGGTRTAAITGAAVALALACRRLVGEGEIPRNPMRELVAAVSVGLLDGTPVLDLDYSEDSRAQVDMNLVATEGGKLVEVQGTAEGDPFHRRELDELLDLGLEGIRSLVRAQEEALER